MIPVKRLKPSSSIHQGLSEPELYGNLVYKLKKIIGRTDFFYQFRKIKYVTSVFAMI